MSLSHTLYQWRGPLYVLAALILSTVMQLSIKGGF
jgi:hypothetical protein